MVSPGFGRRQDRCNRPSFRSARRRSMVQYNAAVASNRARNSTSPGGDTMHYGSGRVTVLSTCGERAIAATALDGGAALTRSIAPSLPSRRRPPRRVADPTAGRPMRRSSWTASSVWRATIGYGPRASRAASAAASPSAGRSSIDPALGRPLRAPPHVRHGESTSRGFGRAIAVDARPSAPQAAARVARDWPAAPRAVATRATGRSAGAAASSRYSLQHRVERRDRQRVDRHERRQRMLARSTRPTARRPITMPHAGPPSRPGAVDDDQVGARRQPLADRRRRSDSRSRCGLIVPAIGRDVDQAGVRRLAPRERERLPGRRPTSRIVRLRRRGSGGRTARLPALVQPCLGGGGRRMRSNARPRAPRPSANRSAPAASASPYTTQLAIARRRRDGQRHGRLERAREQRRLAARQLAQAAARPPARSDASRAMVLARQLHHRVQRRLGQRRRERRIAQHDARGVDHRPAGRRLAQQPPRQSLGQMRRARESRRARRARRATRASPRETRRRAARSSSDSRARPGPSRAGVRAARPATATAASGVRSSRRVSRGNRRMRRERHRKARRRSIMRRQDSRRPIMALGATQDAATATSLASRSDADLRHRRRRSSSPTSAGEGNGRPSACFAIRASSPRPKPLGQRRGNERLAPARTQRGAQHAAPRTARRATAANRSREVQASSDHRPCACLTPTRG